MAIIKCKMCGGDLNIEEGMTVCECEYCGSKQTVPTADNEKKLTLFARANRLRAACEFDKAAGVYESIVADFPEEAEAYWGLVLCRYGIEYVDDPATGKKVPTCHRSSFESIMEDADFDQACENADAIARRVYRDEAKQLEEIRKGIIEVSGKEEPYDIFICYKETAENGERTLDSVIAQDVYDALTDKGYRVFFSRISLEDKLGTEYEPYIFAALNSAKLMLAFGTDFEYYNAVWVKNEWSRFLKLMAADKSRHLIPCYKGIDAYDMPKEFAKLQAQDMGKVGAMQDLLRGIEKILPKAKPETVMVQQTVQQTVVQTASGGLNTDSLLKRGFMALEDGEWDKADGFFEEVLNMDAECAEAYLGLLMAELRIRKREQLSSYPTPLEASKNYEKAMRFGDKAFARELQTSNEGIIARNQAAQCRADEKAQAARKQRLAYAKAAAGLLVAGNDCAVGLTAGGKLFCVGESDNTEKEILGWHGIVSVSYYCEEDIDCPDLAGLQVDGTVITTGYNKKIGTWQNICALTSNAHSLYLAGLKTDGTVVAASNIEEGQCDVSSWRDIVAVAAGTNHIVGLRSNGTVVAAGYNEDGQCGVEGWRDIIAVAAGYAYTAGLKADGTVVAVGAIQKGSRDIQNWRHICAITCSDELLIGLQADGTVVTARYRDKYAIMDGQEDVKGWNDIVAIAAGSGHTLGVRADGTVVTTAPTRQYSNKPKLNVQSWKLFDNIETLAEDRRTAAKSMVQELHARQEADAAQKQRNMTELPRLRARLQQVKGMIAAGYNHTVALRADGTVLATEEPFLNNEGQCDVQNWRNVVEVAAGGNHTIGLCRDGSVVATKRRNYNFSDPCKVQDWRNVTSIATDSYLTAGLIADGTVVCTKDSMKKELSNWRNIIAISVSNANIAGLKANGTVVSTNAELKSELSAWRDIIDINSVGNDVIGLRADGTVVATDEYYAKETAGWRNVVALCDGATAITAEGKILGDENVVPSTGEQDVVAYIKGNVDNSIEHSWCRLGLTANGRVIVLASSGNANFYNAFKDWRLFYNIDTLEEERRLRQELATLGLFSGRRKKEIEARLAELDAELKKLQ